MASAALPIVAPGTPWQVPAYRVATLRPRCSRYAVCVFVINEGQRLHRQLDKMKPLAQQVDVLVVDGGSTDGSVESAVLASKGVNTLLVKTGPGKLSAQMRVAFAYALERGYDGIVTLDGNDKDDPAAIPAFTGALEEGYDCLQGSRFRAGGRAINTPWARWLGVRCVHAPLISLAAGFPYTDTTNGFRAFSRRFLLDPRVAPFRDVFSAYELHYYLAIRAARLNFRVRELPVTRAYPKKGALPTKIKGWRGNWNILLTLCRACWGCYDPNSRGEPPGLSRRA